MSRIFWDTNLFIYLLEDDPMFSAPTLALRRRMVARNDELLTSAMTLGELQVGPRKAQRYEMARTYRETLARISTVLPFDLAAADLYAEIRETSAIKQPDAIQLSCAAAAGVEFFITNDDRLSRLKLRGIQFVTSLNRVPV